MEKVINLKSQNQSLELFGANDKNLRTIRDIIDVKITARDSKIIISGNEKNVGFAVEVIDRIQKRLLDRGAIDKTDVDEILTQVKRAVKTTGDDSIVVYSNKAVIEPFTKGQQGYIHTVLKNDLTFCTGPAGTGKTYLAVAAAVSMLKRKQIRKIVLARPAVEAGERLGFLPGDIAAKVNPYLRPLFDSLEDMMDFSQMRKLMEMDIIEIIPLAFMRGRTLNEAVIICDEAQNTSPSQMLMFLTRMGRGSKMIITGDITQVDLKPGEKSGLVDAIDTLKGIKGIGVARLKEADIVRHSLVQNIVSAYDKKNK